MTFTRSFITAFKRSLFVVAFIVAVMIVAQTDSRRQVLYPYVKSSLQDVEPSGCSCPDAHGAPVFVARKVSVLPGGHCIEIDSPRIRTLQHPPADVPSMRRLCGDDVNVGIACDESHMVFVKGARAEGLALPLENVRSWTTTLPAAWQPAARSDGTFGCFPLRLRPGREIEVPLVNGDSVLLRATDGHVHDAGSK